ncbi:Ig-like domain-containing protein [Mycobacterium sp. SMC-4]|uniref:M23 family metallopeptidase n=1 Tax=Mycobacterium sp. SMC-4 TaxID=2857059 RepID=UPI003D07B9E7
MAPAVVETVTEKRLLTAALAPLLTPVPDMPGESPILLAMLAAARRPATSAESRLAQGAQATSLVAAVPNTSPTITSISAGTAGLFTANVKGRVRATDDDGDKLTYVATATKGTVTINSRGYYTYTPTAAARHASAAVPGWDQGTVTVTVTDGYGGSVSTYIGVAIRPANVKPNARATVGKGNPANGIVTGKINVTDRDGDAVTYVGSGPTSRGTVVIHADGSFVYTPTAAAREEATSIFRRSDRFTVTVSDGHGGVDRVSVRVGIVPPSKNAAPTVGNPSYSITGVNDSNGQVTGYVNIADPDGFGLTYSIVAGIDAATGSLVMDAANGSFTFTPTTGARENAHRSPGEDTVQFTIGGSDGLSTAPVLVTAVISPKAPPPPPPPPPPSTRMRWPLASVQVNRYFGGNGHNGIDLHVTMNPRTPVYAAADGVISFEGYGENHSWMTWMAGISVLVWHPGLNVYSGYAHLSSTVINNGQTVTRGQLIGYAGSTGNSSGPHLHFEVLPRTPNFGNGYSGRIDPLPYLR